MYLFISQAKQRTIFDYTPIPGLLRSSWHAFGLIRKAIVDIELCVSQTGKQRAGLIRKAIVDCHLCVSQTGKQRAGLIRKVIVDIELCVSQIGKQRAVIMGQIRHSWILINSSYSWIKKTVVLFELCGWERQRLSRLQLKNFMLRTTEMSAIGSFADDSDRDVCNWKLCWWQRQRCLQLKVLLMTTTEMSIGSFADDNDRDVCNWKLCWWQRQRCLQLKALLMTTIEMSF